ncbi:hypothetical protein PG984_010517 [Apiospora sp. TS-2023a]
MADPLSILGGATAGLELVSIAAQALLTTLKLIRELRDMPRMLSSLLQEVNDSTSRLYSSCSNGARLVQDLEPVQTARLTQCVDLRHTTLRSIQSILTPLVVAKSSWAAGISQLWKPVMYLGMRKEVEERLKRTNRLNIDLIRELELIGLENNMAIKSLVEAGHTASNEGFKNIEKKLHWIQVGFGELTSSSQNPTMDKKLGSEYDRSYKSGSVLRSDIRATVEEERVSPTRAEHIIQYMFGQTTEACPKLLPPSDLSNATLEYIIYGIRTFYTMGNFDSSPVVARPTFWKDIDLAIYLIKVSHGSQRGASKSQTRGLQILQRSTIDGLNGSWNTWVSGTVSVVLVELLSTLSPINTATCPHVRKDMLRHLDEAAGAQLSGGHRNHPIGLVIQRLLLQQQQQQQQQKNHDNDQRVETTLRALNFLVERLRAIIGPMHELTQLALCRLCRLLRRSGDYTGALQSAREGIREIRALLGPGSLQERRLFRQLEHVYMDQEDWVAALSVGFDIVGHAQFSRQADPDPQHHDECAVMTMEDIAKACEGAGNTALSVAWLKQARMSGNMLWGQSEAVAHIQDGLGELLQQTASQDEIELWTE